MVDVLLKDFRRSVTEHLNRVSYGGQSLRIVKRGKAVAVLVPPSVNELSGQGETKIGQAASSIIDGAAGIAEVVV